MENIPETFKVTEPRRYNTYVLMNKPVYFWGFTSYQLLACFGPVFFITVFSFGIFHLFIGTLILCIVVSPLIYLMGIIRRENNKGNPDFLASWFLARKAPCVITDRNNVMSMIYRNESRNYIKGKSSRNQIV